MEVGKMKHVLVTGSRGFIGRNLIAALKTRNDINVLPIDIDNSKEELLSAIEKADFVVHLAGVNRPKDAGEFQTGNKGFTEEIAELLIKQNRKIPVLLSSSIQAEKDNPYGISKRGAEAVLREYSSITKAPIFLFRLPNVFGKWCRPNYNSVIATWCYNTTHGIDIKINDPEAQLQLVYIDDVVKAFIAAVDGHITSNPEGFCSIEIIYKKNLRQVADIMFSFLESRSSLVIPSMEEDFTRKLYATWLSYLPSDGFSYSLDIKKDNRGWLSEFIKSSAFGQVFISSTKPGITRGNHWHHTKAEKFLVLSGDALIRFRNIEEATVIEYKVNGNELKVVDIPAGYTHSITNVGVSDLVTLFWANEIFNSESPDTYFLEV